MVAEKWLVAVLVLVMGSMAGAQAPATQPSRPVVGEKAREFTLMQLDGKQVQLSSLTKQGPVVMLVLRGWVGYQCPYCTRQVADFMANAAKFKEMGVQVVMVYPGPTDLVKEKATEFAAGRAFPENLHFLLDPDLKVVNQYGLRWDAANETAYPSTLVFDNQGNVKYVKISNSHGDRRSADEVLAIVKLFVP